MRILNMPRAEDHNHCIVLSCFTKADLAYFTDQCILEGMYKIHVRSHVLIIHNVKFSIHRLNAMGKMLNYENLKWNASQKRLD